MFGRSNRGCRVQLWSEIPFQEITYIEPSVLQSYEVFLRYLYYEKGRSVPSGGRIPVSS